MTDVLHRTVISDAADFGRVAVLFGGLSAERDISLISGRAAYRALCDNGIDAHAIDVGEDIIDRLRQDRFDRAFIALHGKGGEDGLIQGLLEILGIPYTGSGVLASALAMDKVMSKQLWRGMELPTPPYRVIATADQALAAIEQLGLPLIVKPACEGSSLGMSKVTQAGHMAAACDAARRFDGQVFAERWIDAREYTATILDGQVLPLIGVETPRVFYDYQAKYQHDDTRYLCPCGLAPAQEAQLQALALRAFDGLGCRGWGRVDLMLDGDGQAWLIEVNTVPGLTDHSLVPMAAAAAGCDFKALMWRILETSVDSACATTAGEARRREVPLP